MARYETASSIIANNAFKKALFQSPSPAPAEGGKGGASTSSTTEMMPSMVSLIYKVQLEQDIETNLFYMKKDMHIQRLKELRELASTLQDDAWMYPPAEKLIGLQ